MKRTKKVLCLAMSFMMLASYSAVSFADTNNDKELLYDPDEKVISTTNVNSIRYRSNSSSEDSKQLFENIKSKLNSYGVKVNKFSDNVDKVSSPKNDDFYYKTIFDEDNAVDIDSKGNLLRVRLLSEDSYISGLEYSVKSKITEDIESRGYDLISQGYIDKENAIISLEFQKKLADGVYNPYESVSVIVDDKNNCLHALNVRDNNFELNSPSITKEEAIKIANDKSNENVNSCQLSVIKPKDYTTDNSNSDMKLAYRIEKDSSIEYIDAENGSFIGTSNKQAKSGKSFSITTNWNGRYIGNMGHDGLTKLGYSMQPKYISSDFGNQLKDFLKSSGSEKGIFVNTHGNPNLISDNKNWTFTRSELRSINKDNRKCRFAYFNSCKGAYDTGWAEDLGIIPGRWGAFVGWSIDVDQVKGVLFAERFWRYANGNRPILKAVELGSNDMPSSYYIEDGENIYDSHSWINVESPLGIRFIGNSTFYGTGR